jgi:hypothetical protein
MLKLRSECTCLCHVDWDYTHKASCCLPDEWIAVKAPSVEHSDIYYDFERNGRRVHNNPLSPVTIRSECKCECHNGGKNHALPCCRPHKVSCCWMDIDGDGNCHIHTAPGVMRYKYNATF